MAFKGPCKVERVNDANYIDGDCSDLISIWFNIDDANHNDGDYIYIISISINFTDSTNVGETSTT